MHSSLSISQTDPRPLYLQVKEQIRRRIALGDWAPGAEIPSIRTLAAAVQVSVITIKRAYLELELEGVIVTRQGKGSFVAEQPEVEAPAATPELDGHLDAALGVAAAAGLDVEKVIERVRELALRHPAGETQRKIS
jgi:GntR family transcriptional regulator